MDKNQQIAVLMGGAGTGKTRQVMEFCSSAKQALDNDPFAVGVTGVTRATRLEAAERAAEEWNMPVETLLKQGWFRTAHSICLRQLPIDHTDLITDNKRSNEWIASALGVHVSTMIDSDTGNSAYVGDKIASQALNLWNLSRCRMEPVKETIERARLSEENLPSFEATRQYVAKYEKAKWKHDKTDFNDLLARFAGVRFEIDEVMEVEPEGEPPAEVRCWVFDEAQDMSALVNRVYLRLAHAPRVKWVYLSGDPFQSVFGFGGSSSKYFMGWDADKKKTMEKTWRCAKPILDLGERCLQRMHRGYFDRGIAPAEHSGKVVRGGHPSSCVTQIDPDESTLIVARCNHTLDAFIEELKKTGLPFMKLKSKDQTIASRACRALWDIEHDEPVAGEDFACAVKQLPARDNLVRGTKKAWEDHRMIFQWDVIMPDQLEEVGFKPELIEKIKAGKWDNLVARGREWRRCAKKYGAELATHPRIRLGTIHSSKGMEADSVILSTSITRRIHDAQHADKEIWDEERRVEYVGVTRARKRLIISDDVTCDYRMRLPL